MSEPEFQKGDMVRLVKSAIPHLVGAPGTIEDHIGARKNDVHYYLVTVEGTTHALNEDWLEYA